MDKVGVGLVGCGNMGRALATGVVDVEQGRMVAVTDVDAERRAQAAEQFECDAVDSIDALLARDDVDAVLVATPGGFHREPVEQVLGAGKHIFCEKPLAAGTEDADAMVAAAEAAGLVHMVGQVVRFHPTHRRLKQMVDDGTLGAVQAMYVERLGGGWGDKHPAWRHSRKQSGGNLLEINAHEIDFMIWLAGRVKTVMAVGGQYADTRLDYPDLTFVSMTFESGAVGVLQSSSITTMPSYAGRFDCASGSAVVEKLFGGPISYQLREGGAGVQRVEPEEMAVERPVTGEIRAFIETIVSGEKTSPVPFQQARHTVAIGEAAYRSVETGKAVDL